MDLFSTVKTHISTIEAAERYGIEVNETAKHCARSTMIGTPACLWRMTTIIALPAESMGTVLTLSPSSMTCRCIRRQKSWRQTSA